MGCRILADSENGACFYCSTSGVAFGPVMANREEAELFLEKYFGTPDDPRHYDQCELMDKYAEFCQNYVCECGGLRDEMDSEMRSQDVNGPCTCEGYIDSDDACAYCKDVYAAQNAKLTERFVCYICARKTRPLKGRKQFPPSNFRQRARLAAEPEDDMERDRR
jgi:hypothetical protein